MPKRGGTVTADPASKRTETRGHPTPPGDQPLEIDWSVLDSYPCHPFAARFPLIGDSEMRALADDIRRHGQQEPIWTYQGTVLDGRNRLVACAHVGVTPTMREWQPRPGETPVSFIVSRNLHRRHLTQSQRAALAVEMERELLEENRRLRRDTRPPDAPVTAPAAFSHPDPPSHPPAPGPVVADPFTGQPLTALVDPPRPPRPTGRARDQAARAFKVSTGYVADARNLADAYPERFAEISAPGQGKSIPKVQEEILEEALAKAGRDLAEATPADPALEDVRLRPGTIRQTLTRLQTRQSRLGGNRPPVSLKKFGKVQSSRTHVTILVTFGNPTVGETLLNAWNDDRRVLDLRYKVVPDDKALARERARYSQGVDPT